MKTIVAEQNSKEWHELRKTRLGASDACIVLKTSLFMSPFQLWKQKRSDEIPNDDDQNFIQMKGHKYERKMRELMGFLYSTDFEGLTVLSEEYPHLMASLDGYSEEIGCIWENKYVGQDDFEKVNNGEMLAKYVPQVQQQLMLTGAPFCVFSVIADDPESDNKDFPFKYAYIEIQPDHEFMQTALIPKMREFWDMVQSGDKPDFTDIDVVDLSDNEEMTELIAKYSANKDSLESAATKESEMKAKHKKEIKDISKNVKDLTKEEDKLKSAIFKLNKYKRAICNGVKLTLSKPRETKDYHYDKFIGDSELVVSDEYIKIDYKKFIKDEKIEIPEKYQFIKKGNPVKLIKFPEPQQD